MSIFKCDKCGCVDNTAVTNYWHTKKKLCSACDPQIKKWHQRFKRFKPEDEGLVEGPDGFLHNPKDDYYKRLVAESRKKAKVKR